MAWPATAVGTADLITAAQLNGLPVMIANSTLSGDAANIDFTSIPSHYAHLMLVCYLRGDTAAIFTGVQMRFNGDGGANYDQQHVLGQAAVASAAEAFAGVWVQIGNATANSGGANLFSPLVLTIPHYANSANNKAGVSQFATKYGTATTNLHVGNLAVFWRSSAAINRITILPAAGNWRSGSRVTLYGLA
jgi:hypothetical protein